MSQLEPLLALIEAEDLEVIPCRVLGKQPWPDSKGQPRRDLICTSEEQVMAVAMAKPACNWAVELGEDHLVLDLDNEDAVKVAKERGFTLPDTLIVKTPGGWHLHYRTPVPVKGGNDRLGQGLDVKAGPRSYVLLPPSFVKVEGHPGRGTYEGEYRVHADNPIREAPAALLEALRDAEEPKQQEKQRKQDSTDFSGDTERIPDGRRHDAWKTTAGWMLHHGFPRDFIAETMRRMNAEVFTTPKPVSECEKQIHDMLNRWDRGNAGGFAVPESELQVVCAAQIEPEMTQWTLRPYLAAGEMTYLSGDPDTGKTTILCAWTAELTGRGLPVLWLLCEDSDRRTLVPRLMAAKADLEQVHVLKAVTRTEDGLRALKIPDDVESITQAARNVGAAAVFCDALNGVLSTELDTGKGHHVRDALGYLTAEFDAHGLAAGFVRHDRKEGAKVVHKSSGIVDFSAAARIELSASRWPEDDTEPQGDCLLAVRKNNLVPEADKKSVAYSFVSRPVRVKDRKFGQWVESSAVAIEWTGETDLSATQAAEGKTGRPNRQDEMRDQIQIAFKGREEVLEADLEHLALERGFYMRSFREVLKVLHPIRQRDGDGEWVRLR